MIHLKTTKKQADKITAEQNEKYTASGAAVVSVSAVLTSFYTVTIPTDRKEEFEAAHEAKQQQFINISKACFSAENLGKDFLTAWNIEYNKIY